MRSVVCGLVWTSIVLASSLAFAQSEPPPAPTTPAPAATRDLKFFLLGNLDGEIADVDCRGEQPVADEGLNYARQVAYFKQLDQPIALDVGNSTFPGALARFLLTSRGGAQAFAGILDQVPFQAHALGDDELGMERSQLLHFVQGARQVGLPLRDANVVCNDQGGAEAICDALGTGPNEKPWTIVERGGVRIGVLSVLDPKVTKYVAKARTTGLDFDDPADVLSRLITKMNAQDHPDVVAVIYHAVGPAARDEAVALATKVDGIDLMFTNRLLTPGKSGGPITQNGYVLAPKTGTYVVGADTGVDSAVTVDVHLSRPRPDNAWSIEGIDSKLHATSNVVPDKTTAGLLRQAGEQFCAKWGKAIRPGMALAKPFDRSDLEQFILNVMRFSTHSEVALVNKDTFVHTHFFPIEKTLTLADIYAFVPYNNHLVTVEIPGSELEKLAGKLGDQLVAAGLTKEGDKVKINGRAIQKDRTYKVATHAYLASGGDDVLAQDKIKHKKLYEAKWSSEPPTIGSLVAHVVKEAAFPDDASVTDKLAPDDSFPDLYRRFLWSYVGSINASFNKVTVQNPSVDGAPAYDQSQLTVASTTQINLEGNGEVKADSRNHVWDTTLLVQYAEAKLPADQNGQSQFEQTKDLIRLTSTYQYAGFRANAGDKWYVPMPFGELQVESEFDPPAERDWHKVETTGIAGTKFQLFSPLEIKVGANVRRDLLEPGGQTTYGLNAGYTLSRTNLAKLADRPIQVESKLEYFYNDIGASNIQELRNTDRLYFAVMDQLFFTTTFQAFLYRTDEVGQWGTNTDVTVGLNYLWDETVQSF